MDKDVAVCMGRADLDEMHVLVANFHVALADEGLIGEKRLKPGEIEWGTKKLEDEIANFTSWAIGQHRAG